MSETYTKLFTSITVSTIWQEPMETRLTWITMLAMADQNGDVYAAIPGLARMANVPIDKVEMALACLLAPDPYSRSKENDGRRIEEIDGGWRLLNHSKFHAMRMEAERAAYKREWDRKNRPSGSARKSDSPTEVRQSPTKSDISDRPDPPDQTRLLEQEQKLSAQPAASRFADWWAVYPKKVGRKPAEQKWRSHKLDAIADTLIADVRERTANDDGWRRGFIPDPVTYLNQERWNDDLRTAPVARAVTSEPSKTLGAMQKLQGIRHGLAGNRASERPHQVALIGAGSDPSE